MTVHEAFEEQIDLYFEGSIRTVKDRDALFGHLDRCPDCRRYFDETAAAQRLLTGDTKTMPSTELALIGEMVVAEAAPEPKPLLQRLFDRRMRWAGLLAPVAAVALAAVLWPVEQNGRPTLTPKGDRTPTKPSVEALCFDQQANMTIHLKQNGTCPAPGFLKVIYAAPKTVPQLTVAAFAGEEMRFLSQLERPKPRSIVPQHTALSVGDVVRIIATSTAADRARLERLEPTLVVRGVAP